MIFGLPSKYFLVAGTSDNFMPLNAFDGALIDAGIANVNIVKMSSIIPPGCLRVDPIELPYGSIVPVAYAYIMSPIPGEIISAAIACAIPVNNNKPGLIMEYSSSGHKKEVEDISIKMAKEGMRLRNEKIRDIECISVSHKVNYKGAAFAGVVLWY